MNVPQSNREFRHWQDLVIHTALYERPKLGQERAFDLPHSVAAAARLYIGMEHSDEGYTFQVIAFEGDARVLRMRVVFTRVPE